MEYTAYISHWLLRAPQVVPPSGKQAEKVFYILPSADQPAGRLWIRLYRITISLLVLSIAFSPYMPAFICTSSHLFIRVFHPACSPSIFCNRSSVNEPLRPFSCPCVHWSTHRRQFVHSSQFYIHPFILQSTHSSSIHLSIYLSIYLRSFIFHIMNHTGLSSWIQPIVQTIC